MAAAVFLLTLGHDYILMRNDRGFVYMSELDIGMKVSGMVTLIRNKIGNSVARRDLVLRAAKLAAKEAAVRGIISSACDGAGRRWELR